MGFDDHFNSILMRKIVLKREMGKPTKTATSHHKFVLENAFQNSF
jgi:hypothetical protein